MAATAEARRTVTSSITLTIDGRQVEALPGRTILQAASAAGIRIPHLCHDPRLRPAGACRLCLVEIKGQPGLQTACTRTAEAGMVVETDNAAVRGVRKTVLEMIVSEHNMSCSTCDRDGDCELQNYAYEYAVDEKRHPSVMIPPGTPNYSTESIGIDYDPSKCIRCQRCVRICEEVQGAEALTLMHRGGEAQVTTGFARALQDTSCEMCGQCIGTCPTAALHEKAARGRGKRKDLAVTRTTCVWCGVGCQLELNVDRAANRIVRVTARAGSVPNDGNLCVKGRFGMDYVGRPDRLTTPLVREGDALRPATWDEALQRVAEGLGAVKAAHGSDALAGLGSAKATNEDNYVFQRMVRAGFGTNNVDHCARLCHASTVSGLAMAFGSGAMTNSIRELSDTPVVLVIGSNTTECHPVIGIKLRQAVATGRTRLIVADPRRISLSRIAEIHLRHKPGTDVALVNGLMAAILEEGLEKMDFISARTEGIDALREAVKECPPSMAARITGVPEAEIRRAARLYAGAPSAAIVYAMGITQHATGTDNVLSLANLAMLTGNVGREHAGLNPLRGQNNVQGVCDMGVLPNVYTGYQRVDDAGTRAKFAAAWGCALPAAPGLTIVEMMDAARAGRIRGMYVMGENPVLSDPDSGHVREALEALDFLVVQDVFMSETAELADVVLPAFTFAEKEGTFTNTERRVQRVRRAVRPPGDARDDWRILCEVSARMGHAMPFADGAAIMDEIAKLTPIYGGIAWSRLEGIGIQWPCTSREHPGTPILHTEKFTRGKGRFHAVRFLPARELPDAEYPVLLTTGRLLEHWHTGTMTRRSAVLDALVPHGFLELNPADAEELRLAPGGTAVVTSRRGRIQVPVDVTEKVERGTVFLAFHFKEHAANELTIAALDPIAKIPEYKVCAVRVERAEGDARAVPPNGKARAAADAPAAL